MIFKEVTEDKFAEMSFFTQTMYYVFHPLHRNTYYELIKEGMLEMTYRALVKEIIQNSGYRTWLQKSILVLEIPAMSFLLWIMKIKIKAYQKNHPEELL